MDIPRAMKMIIFGTVDKDKKSSAVDHGTDTPRAIKGIIPIQYMLRRQQQGSILLHGNTQSNEDVNLQYVYVD